MSWLKYYVILKADLTQEMMDRCHEKNPYKLTQNIAGTKVIYPVDPANIPSTLFSSAYDVYTETTIATYLSTPSNGFVYASPTDIALTVSTIIESATVGTAIGTLSATDAEDGTHTYTITTDADSKFQIDGTTLEVGGALDFSADESHDVTIRVTNNTTELYYEEEFTIDVTSAWTYDTGYQFDGVTTYAKNESMEIFDGESSFTFGVMLDFDATADDFEYYFSKIGVAPDVVSFLRFNASIYFRAGGGGTYSAHGCTASSGEYLFTGVYDGTETGGSRLKIYKNGTLLSGTSEATAAATIEDGVDAWIAYVGIERAIANWTGAKLLDMFIVREAMTASEISALYNSGDYKDISDIDGLTVLAHWTFGESDNDTTSLIEDIAGSYDLTAYNFSAGDIS